MTVAVAATPRRSRAARRARLWLTAAAIAAFLPALGMPLRGWLDFAAFYAAGHFAGTSSLYDLEAVVRYQAANGMQPVPFVYPASVALAYAPFAALPFSIAAAVHLALMVAALVAAAAVWGDLLGLPRRWAILGALAWGPAAASAVSGQNATVVLLLLGLGTRALVANRPAIAGLISGIALAKPQLGVGGAAGVALRGGGRALAGLGAAAAIQYLAGVVASGGDLGWPRSWLEAVTAYTRDDIVANGWQASSVASVGTVLAVRLGSGVPVVAGYLVAVAVAVASLRRLGQLRPERAIAQLVAVALVLNPHAWVYDLTLLLPALGVVAVEARARGWPAFAVRGLVLSFAIASLWALGGFVGLTLLPLVSVGVPLAVATWTLPPYKEGSRPGDASRGVAVGG